MADTASSVEVVVGRFAAALRETLGSVERVILFGSHATGQAGPFSDIDVAVVSQRFRGLDYLSRCALLARALRGIRAPIQAIALTPRELREAELASILSEIARTGRDMAPDQALAPPSVP
ncbi:MAG: nucleotidyltransferase domain-containing protein [Deltaproteobacteria bacterium]|nr:nucleotidyltransferase domain-containing protein [Deltaproteobacteria bacterium]